MEDPNVQPNVSPENVPDPISQEIDSLFGTGEGDTNEEGPKPTGVNPSEGASADTPTEDYTGLNAEQLARMFQSKYDKTQAELNKAQQKLQANSGLEEFIDSVYNDPEVRHAFLSEIAPDLVKPKDPYSVIEEQLKKEFGEDFVPDDEEAKKPLSPSWKYFRRVDKLMDEVEKQSKKVPSSLKELREQRKAQREAAIAAAEEEKKRVLAEMKWRDEDFDQFSGWVKKLSAKDLAKIYRYVRTKGGVPPSNIVNIPGGTTPKSNANMAELNKYFG